MWLEEVSKKVVEMECERALESHSEEGHLEAVYSLLTRRQIDAACQVCFDKDDKRLAMLIAVATNEQTRFILQEQLANWSLSGVDEHISPMRLTIYTLLSGKCLLYSFWLPTFRCVCNPRYSFVQGYSQ